MKTQSRHSICSSTTSSPGGGSLGVVAITQIRRIISTSCSPHPGSECYFYRCRHREASPTHVNSPGRARRKRIFSGVRRLWGIIRARSPTAKLLTSWANISRSLVRIFRKERRTLCLFFSIHMSRLFSFIILRRRETSVLANIL